jgi:hypothetical protein
MLSGSMTSQIIHLQNNFTGTLRKIEKKGCFYAPATASNKQICKMLPLVALRKFASVGGHSFRHLIYMAKSKFYLVSNFLRGVGAAHNLLADAIESKSSFIEQVCLSATLIDGLLRLSLVMEHQLETGKGVVDPMLLYQGKRQRKFIPEREIYKRAQNEKIITKVIERKLNVLYDKRNIIIHRYLISEIKTIEVIQIAKKYFELYLAIKERHRIIDNKLRKAHIGMAQQFIHNPSDKQIHEEIIKKHF